MASVRVMYTLIIYGKDPNFKEQYLLKIFNFGQTAAQILKKFGSYMHLSKVYQV